MPPDRPHPHSGQTGPDDYSSLRGDAVGHVAVDDPLTRSPIGMGQHDVDVLVGHFRFAVPAGTGHARHYHAAQGPYLALRVRDLPAVPVDPGRPDRPGAARYG